MNTTALIVHMAFLCAGVVFTVAYSLYQRYLNRKLDKDEALMRPGKCGERKIGFHFQTLLDEDNQQCCPQHWALAWVGSQRS